MKFLRYFICLAILAGSLTGVCSAEDNGVEYALSQVKQKFDTSQYDNFESNYYKDGKGNIQYEFSWYSDEPFYKNLLVEYKDGVVTRYGSYSYEAADRDSNASIFAFSEDEALEIARDFLKRVNPDIADRIVIAGKEYTPSIYENSYYFSLYLTENSLPILGQTGSISVSSAEKEVTDFYLNYTGGVDFKPCDGIIDEDAAKDAYKKQISPELKYDFSRDYQKGEIKAYLEYVSRGSDYAINAYNGNCEKISDIMYGYREEAAKDANAAGGAALEGFSPAEMQEITKMQELLTEDQARDIIKGNGYIKYDDSYYEENVSLIRDRFNKDKYYYTFNFDKKDEEYGYLRAVLDASDGTVIEFYRYNDFYEGDRDVNKEIEMADVAFKELSPKYYGEYRANEGQNEGTIIYTRYINDIEVVGDVVYISFDSKDNLIGYSINHTEGVEFPSPDGAISADAAAEAAFGQIGFGLCYAIDGENKTATPVYTILKNAYPQQFTENAFTGHLIDYRGEDVKEEERISYSDIDGHYGQQIFTKLAEYGIGFSGGSLEPDRIITQSEFLSLLHKAFSYDERDINEVYRNMVSSGIITKESRADDSPVTREDAAVLMIRELGAESYAKYEEIYLSPFEDVVTNKGYIALLKAMKVVSGDGNGFFRPQNEITRGEALVMIYNYFNKQ